MATSPFDEPQAGLPRAKRKISRARLGYFGDLAPLPWWRGTPERLAFFALTAFVLCAIWIARS